MLSDPGNAEALYKWGTLQQHVLHRPERAGAGPREQVQARESRCRPERAGTATDLAIVQ